jgi:hypothetical protein
MNEYTHFHMCVCDAERQTVADIGETRNNEERKK